MVNAGVGESQNRERRNCQELTKKNSRGLEEGCRQRRLRRVGAITRKMRCSLNLKILRKDWVEEDMIYREGMQKNA